MNCDLIGNGKSLGLGGRISFCGGVEFLKIKYCNDLV